ncbi:MAG: hypothetical protein AABZ06_08560, partial [Bdellovibrionota bacterium]
MFQKEVLLSSEEAKPSIQTEIAAYNISGKVFILGEYSVLADGTAVIAAVGPRFGMRVLRRNSECDFFDADSFHPKSPAARLVDFA